MKTRKPKFRPVISRIKLNPEQAVLSCGCYEFGMVWAAAYGSNTQPPPDNICWIEDTEKMMLGGGTCEIIPGPYPVGTSSSPSEGQS